MERKIFYGSNIKLHLLEYSQINGDFDIAANIEFDKSRVAELDAKRVAQRIISSLCPDRIEAKVSQDSEQRVEVHDEKEVLQIGFKLYHK